MNPTRRYLRSKLDKCGWRYPFHEHFRLVEHEGTLTTQPCPAKQCEAPGCPRTDSGFPEPGTEVAK